MSDMDDEFLSSPHVEEEANRLMEGMLQLINGMSIDGYEKFIAVCSVIKHLTVHFLVHAVRPEYPEEAFDTIDELHRLSKLQLEEKLRKLQ